MFNFYQYDQRLKQNKQKQQKEFQDSLYNQNYKRKITNRVADIPNNNPNSIKALSELVDANPDEVIAATYNGSCQQNMSY